MRNSLKIFRSLLVLSLVFFTITAMAQKIQNWRPYDQRGINMFEPPKDTDANFEGLKVRVGGSFTQQFQALSHSNDTLFLNYPGVGSEFELAGLGSGFNTANANLYLDAQLADGIRVAIESYMSSKHHTEFWVKGGYIQVDKLPMFDNPDWYTDYVRVKIGHFQPNYGDQQFRRTDNGNAIYNPFVGNYVMDAFTTEIGGEIYLFPTENIVGMIGITSGLIKGDIKEYENGRQKQPSVYLKLAYDKEFNDDTRFRLSGSMMANGNSGRNTLYGGDRAGTRFSGVMDLANGNANDFAGRWNPRFTNKIMAFQFNPFVKFKGLEFFGIYERANGNNLVFNSEKGIFEFNDENKRAVTQLGGEVVYRFLKDEQLYIGGKYNVISGELSANLKEEDGGPIYDKASISRMEIGAGWFITKNLLLKGVYVDQQYKDFPAHPSSQQFYNGEFNGFVFEAVVGF